jgi:nucleoid DNA-binding protein
LFKTSKLALLEYIKDQLLFYNSVTLPGLGSFEIRRTSAVIKGKKIVPPGANIIFNQEKSLDDKILSNSIAAAEEISLEEAGQKVLECIDLILFALNKDEVYIFEGFGKLFRDSENVIRFEKDPDFKIEFESFGLESFELDPIEELLQENRPIESENTTEQAENKSGKSISEVKAKTFVPVETPELAEVDAVENEYTSEKSLNTSIPKETKNNRGIFWILTGAVIVILISFVLISLSTDLLDNKTFSIFNANQDEKTGLFPEDDNWDLESSLNSDLGEAIDSMTLQENALTIQETSAPEVQTIQPSGEYLEYHIIAGSFKDKVNAGIMQQALTEKGYPALVIQQGDNLYRVSAISFKDKEEGLRELDQFKDKTKNNAAWLLSLK